MIEPTPVIPKKSMARRLGGATLNYGMGSVLPQIVSFLLIPVFTAFLGPADYGLLELAATFGAFLVVAMRLGVPGAVTRFYFEYRESESVRDYVTTIAWFVVLASLVVGGLTLALMPFVGDLIVPGLDFFPFIVIVVITSIFSGNSDLQRRLIQAREQSSHSLRLNLFTALLTTCASLIFVAVLRWGPAGVLLAEAAGSIVLYLHAVRYLRDDLVGRFNKTMLRDSLRYAGGILPSHLMGTLAPVASRAILVQLQSLTELGLFGLASRFARPMTIAVTAFSSAFLPIYFAERKIGTEESHQRLAQATSGAWLFAIAAFVAISIVGPPAIAFMTPERFHAAAPIVPWLALAGLAQMLSAVAGAEIYYRKATWIVPFLALANIVSSLGFTLVLVKPFGATGLAIANSLGMCASAAIAVWHSRRLVRLPLRWLSMARTGVLGLTLVLVARWGRWDTPLLELAIGVVLCTFLPLVLWIMNDPALGEALKLGRKRFKPRSAP